MRLNFEETVKNIAAYLRVGGNEYLIAYYLKVDGFTDKQIQTMMLWAKQIIARKNNESEEIA